MTRDGFAISRRGLLIGAGGVAAVAAAGTGAVTVFDLFGPAPLSALDRDDVTSQLGTVLEVRSLDDERLGELTVAEVVELPMPVGEPARQFAFRLASRRPLGLSQDTYLISHSRFGSTPLFLSPLARGGDGSDRYEVLVNRPVDLAHLEVAR